LSELEGINAEQKELSSFKVMVDAVMRTGKQWKTALILSNLFWMVLFAVFLILSYMQPTEIEQVQDFPEQRQEQKAKGVD